MTVVSTRSAVAAAALSVVALLGCADRAPVGGEAAPGDGGPQVPGNAGCGEQPQVLARLDPAALDIEVDDQHVYIGRRDGIWRVPRAGGSLEHIASVPDKGQVSQIHLRGDDLYWVETTFTGPPDYSFHKLRRSNKQGLTQAELAAASWIQLLENGSDRLHWVSSDTGSNGLTRLVTTTADGSASEAVLPRSSGRWLFADQEALYWVEGIYDAAVTWTIPLAGGDARTWKPGSHRLVAADADNVYAMKYIGMPGMREQWQVLRMDRQGSTQQELARIIDPSDDGDYRFVRDGEHLFWSDEYGHAWRVPVAGGAPVPVGQGNGFDVDDSFPPLLVAVDRDHVYWQVAPPEVDPSAYEPGPMLLVRACKPPPP